MKGEDPLSVLVPSLHDHNVRTIAELSSNIPTQVIKTSFGEIYMCMHMYTSVKNFFFKNKG